VDRQYSNTNNPIEAQVAVCVDPEAWRSDNGARRLSIVQRSIGMSLGRGGGRNGTGTRRGVVLYIDLFPVLG
jgi:hypothetical protein